ncbi:MAG: hypothetical protein V3U94_02820 [Candidatus Thorarchaeota archaeon]
MGNLAFGTSYFVNINSAITYYEDMGFSADDVREKLIEGEIHIGEPEAWAGHYLRLDEEGRFHQVRFDPSGLNEAGDHGINEALKEANKAMDKRTNKILDWIYGAREVMLIINAIMLFGIVCYLLFLGV